jgi:nucleotide-binding universal stress UspA family protein
VTKKEKVLMAIDDDVTANDVAKYAARIISGEKSLVICLLHMIAPLPPQLREFRGAEDPKMEQRLDHEIDLKCERWTETADRAAQALFHKVTSVLTQAGVASSSIETCVRQLVNHEDLIDDILGVAKEKKCQTIVVGRSSFPWLKELFHRHVADELVRKGSGFTIWVVQGRSKRL